MYTREPAHSVAEYCSSKPFDTKPQQFGGGAARGDVTDITSEDVKVVSPSGQISQPATGGKVDASLDGLQNAGSGMSGGGISTFSAPEAAPSAMDNFARLASNPRGEMGDAMISGWKKGVNINTAEKGSKLGFLDTLGSGVSGALGGAKREVEGAFSSGASQSNMAFDKAAEEAQKKVAEEMAKKAAEEAARKAAEAAAAQAATSQAAGASAATSTAGAAAGW